MPLGYFCYHCDPITLTDVNECLEGKHHCSKYARCKNVEGGYSCECLTGFEGDGETCISMFESISRALSLH